MANKSDGFEAEYRAMQGMRVKFPDGTYHDLVPGDLIPKETTDRWHNPALWVKRGFCERIDGMPVAMGARGPYEPPRALTDADVARIAKSANSRDEFSSPFPKAGPGDIGPGQGQRAAVVDPTEAEMKATPKGAPKASAKKLSLLKKQSRAKLLEVAGELGVTVNKSDSKDDIAQRLLAAGEQ